MVETNTTMPRRTGAAAWAAFGAYKRAEKLTVGQLRIRYELLIADDAAGCCHGATTWREMQRQFLAAEVDSAADLTPGQRSQLLSRALDCALRAYRLERAS
jgi:hypothetical protein